MYRWKPPTAPSFTTGAASRLRRHLCATGVRWTGARLRSTQFSLTLFSHQLLVLVRSGLPLLEAIETLSAKEKRTSVGVVSSQLIELLRQGLSFARAGTLPRGISAVLCRHHPRQRAHRRSVEALSRYLTYRTQLDAVRKRLVSAMLYPALLVFVGGLIVVFLLTYVVPRFSRVYEDMGDRLPLLSRLLIGWGKAFEAYGLWIGVLFALGLVFAGYWLSRPATMRSLLDRLRGAARRRRSCRHISSLASTARSACSCAEAFRW